MLAPVVVRYFAAVEVATQYETFRLNRERLETAIQILSEIPYIGNASAERRMHMKYPFISQHQMYQYMTAAQACVDHNVKP